MLIKKLHIVFLTALACIVVTVGCSESINDSIRENRQPDTFIFLYPDAQLGKQLSRLHLHWWGDDPDGLIRGYYIKWQGIDTMWTFTSANDSIFSLPIGTADTSYIFLVRAVDASGNGIFDDEVIRGGINFGSEPFTDLNNDGIFNPGENFIDIGLVDDSPAGIKFPIVNSSPVLYWNEESRLPGTSFPVMSAGWRVEDLDGIETIQQINIALNDTNRYISLNRSVNFITLIFDPLSPGAVKVLRNGSANDIHSEYLQGLKLNSENTIYARAVDISGSKSPFMPLPDTSSSWYVREPSGKLLIVDDYSDGSPVTAYYQDVFNQLADGSVAGKYDIMNLQSESLPYENITFTETLKLFDYIYWFSDSSPRIDLMNLVTRNFTGSGGKIGFSAVFQDSSSEFDFSVFLLQSILPVQSLGQSDPLGFLFPGAELSPVPEAGDYPELKTAATISFVRTYVPNFAIAQNIYNLNSSQLKGTIALMDKEKSVFFVGLPLHQCDGIPGNVRRLLEKVYIEEFGMGK